MAAPSWNISGQYFETCSCDYLCPCILGQMAVRPTKGSCTFAMAMQVERGTFGSVPLGGVTFIVLGYTPEEMVKATGPSASSSTNALRPNSATRSPPSRAARQVVRWRRCRA